MNGWINIDRWIHSVCECVCVCVCVQLLSLLVPVVEFVPFLRVNESNLIVVVHKIVM